jgi:hypothetical protein
VYSDFLGKKRDKKLLTFQCGCTVKVVAKSHLSFSDLGNDICLGLGGSAAGTKDPPNGRPLLGHPEGQIMPILGVKTTSSRLDG